MYIHITHILLVLTYTVANSMYVLVLKLTRYYTPVTSHKELVDIPDTPTTQTRILHCVLVSMIDTWLGYELENPHF